MADLTVSSDVDTFMSAANRAAMRAALDLEPGTDIQAQDAELTAIAGLTSAANQLPYFTGSGTAALTSLTAAGRAILDDANAAAQRTTLGLGTIATQAANSVSISGGTVLGITDLAVADGGTGASDASGARTNLGLVIGTNVQAYRAALLSSPASDPTGISGADAVTNIVSLTQAEYDAIGSPSATTFYIITS
jgi:hypothetical protein